MVHTGKCTCFYCIDQSSQGLSLIVQQRMLLRKAEKNRAVRARRQGWAAPPLRMANAECRAVSCHCSSQVLPMKPQAAQRRTGCKANHMCRKSRMRENLPRTYRIFRLLFRFLAGPDGVTGDTPNAHLIDSSTTCLHPRTHRCPDREWSKPFRGRLRACGGCGGAIRTLVRVINA